MVRENLILGEGPTPCEGMIIGEAPGAEEEKQGRPFVGRSGELLTEALGAFGVKRTNVYITNVYKLRPPHNRTPTDKEVSKHSMHLQRELTAVNPRVILCVGATATGVFFTTDRMSKMRGIMRTLGDWHILPTWHPSYVLRMGYKTKDEFYEDIHTFVTTMKEGVPD